jgi:hypothetical protein
MRGAQWVEKDRYVARDGGIRFEDWEFANALVLGTRAAIEYCLAVGERSIWAASQTAVRSDARGTFHDR